MENTMSYTAVIVEDNATSADITVRQLEAMGFATHVADSAEAGWNLAQEINPELMVVDERLPDLSGTELIRSLRANMPDVTVIMSTIVDDERAIRNAFAAGCNYYAIKPNGLLKLCKSFTSPESLLNTQAQELFSK